MMPDDAHINKARNLGHEIGLELQRGQFPIDRFRIMGSVAKETAVKLHMDFDLVVYLNKVDGKIVEHEDAIENFKEVLKKINDYNIVIKGQSAMALHVDVDEFDFDIVPAVNLSQHPTSQYQQILQIISKETDRKMQAQLCSSLSEFQVKFVREQSYFTKHLILLAKCWMLNVFLPSYIIGQSSLIELIAIKVAKIAQNNPNEAPSMSWAFR